MEEKIEVSKTKIKRIGGYPHWVIPTADRYLYTIPAISGYQLFPLSFTFQANII
jgi:hypothetical protein